MRGYPFFTLAIASSYEEVFNALVRLAPKPEYLNIQNNELFAPSISADQPAPGWSRLVVAGATTQIQTRRATHTASRLQQRLHGVRQHAAQAHLQEGEGPVSQQRAEPAARGVGQEESRSTACIWPHSGDIIRSTGSSVTRVLT